MRPCARCSMTHACTCDGRGRAPRIGFFASTQAGHTRAQGRARRPAPAACAAGAGPAPSKAMVGAAAGGCAAAALAALALLYAWRRRRGASAASGACFPGLKGAAGCAAWVISAGGQPDATGAKLCTLPCKPMKPTLNLHNAAAGQVSHTSHMLLPQSENNAPCVSSLLKATES